MPGLPGVAAAAPTAPAVAPEGKVFSTESAALARVLDQYELAYQRLDAGAAAALWPSVDRSALTRAFARLSMQHLTFGDCTFAVSANDATAQCAGMLRYARRFGDTRPQAESHVWTIEFVRAGAAWRIARMTAQ